jgi:hypothetical protein
LEFLTTLKFTFDANKFTQICRFALLRYRSPDLFTELFRPGTRGVFTPESTCNRVERVKFTVEAPGLLACGCTRQVGDPEQMRILLSRCSTDSAAGQALIVATERGRRWDPDCIKMLLARGAAAEAPEIVHGEVAIR